MRVALFTNILAPYRRPLFNAIGAHVDLHVVLSAPAESDRLWPPDQGKPGDRFTTHVLPGRALTLPGGIMHLNTGIAPLLHRLRPDAVICSSFAPVSAAAALCARRLGAQVITWSEATPHSERGAGLARRAVRRLLAPLSHAFVASGKEAREYLLAIGAPAEAIFLGVDAIEAPPPPPAHDVVSRRAQCRGPVVLYSGNLNRHKNVLALLDAFAAVARRHTSTLVVMGTGPLEPECRQRAAELGLPNVIFPGFQDERDKWAWYHAADLLVLPTLIDRWGLVVNEAMLAGLPVVCSCYAGAAADLVHHGETGVVFDPYVDGELEQALQRLVAGRDIRLTMSQAARRHIADYSIERSAAGFLAALGIAAKEDLWKAA